MTEMCYFVKLSDKNLINNRRWYVDELRMLREMGYNVSLCTKFSAVFKRKDVYVSWWAQTSLFSVLAAKLYMKRCFVISGGIEVSRAIPNAGYNRKNIFKRCLIQLTLRLCDVIIAVSEYNKREILDITNNRYADKIKVLYHCVSDAYIEKQVVSNFADHGKYYLLITGFIKGNLERKCVYQIIDAIYEISKKISDIKLIIAGAVEDLLEYQKLVEYIKLYNMEDNIEVVTNVTEEEKIKLLNNAYYYVQPSFHEQFGVAIAEAMACGCPVISTDVAAVPEVVGDTGVLIKKNTQEEIIMAIEKTYFDEHDRYMKAVAAQKRAKELFTYEIKKKKFRDILSSD